MIGVNQETGMLEYDGWIRCSETKNTTFFIVNKWYKVDSTNGIKDEIDSTWMKQGLNVDVVPILKKHRHPLSAINKYMKGYNCTKFDKFSHTNPYEKTKEAKEEQPKKSKLQSITTQVKIDLLFDQPAIEETNEDVYIFSGRTTIYFNTELGIYGVATCHSDELKTYSKLVGKSIAFYRAYNSK